MERNEKLINQINKVVQMNVDRVLGYEKAYSLVESKALKELFEQCISQSDSYATKLRSTMTFHGVSMKWRPSTFGLIFRGWMQLKISFCKNKDRAVLRSCLEAENVLALNYKLICDNKYLQYYYPLLKYTFLKQQFSLKQTREQIENALQAGHREKMSMFTPARDMALEEDPAFTTS